MTGYFDAKLIDRKAKEYEDQRMAVIVPDGEGDFRVRACAEIGDEVCLAHCPPIDPAQSEMEI